MFNAPIIIGRMQYETNRRKAKPIGGKYKRKEFRKLYKRNSATVKEAKIMMP